MSTLVLELRQGDCMVVNGAAIRFRNKARIEMTARARFLFGKQILGPAEANTPARRLYFALQTAYIGDDAERQAGLEDARRYAAELGAATTSPSLAALLELAVASAAAGDGYQALRYARRIIRHEDAVLKGPPQAKSESSAA